MKAPTAVATNEDRIRSFAALAPDWDSYGAHRIEADVIERALRLLPFLEKAGLKVWAVPCSDGGVLFEGIGEHTGYDVKVEP